MDIRASLAALSASSGPSGREQQTLERAMELLRPLVDEVSRDRFGNLIGVRRCGKENAKRVVLDAHLDEVGLVITGAKDGFLRFRPVGGIDPRMLPDREVTSSLTRPALAWWLCSRPMCRGREMPTRACLCPTCTSMLV